MTESEIHLDRNSHIPYFAQVIDILRDRIDSGIWLAGTQIPGEPELCKMFDVSRTVIRQALAELDHDGLIVRKKGKGTFVAEPKIGESLVQRLTGFYEDMVERGLTPVLIEVLPRVGPDQAHRLLAQPRRNLCAQGRGGVELHPVAGGEYHQLGVALSKPPM